MRAENIKARVLRNLRKYGITTSDVFDEDVYDELTQAVSQIQSEVQPGKIITVTLATDQDSYDLSSEHIGEVKLVEYPSSWIYVFELVSNKDFTEKVNANSNTNITQPVIGTVIDGKLKIFPKPTSDDNDVDIKFWTSLSSNTATVDENTEPETPPEFDKALEYFATAQFVPVEATQGYMTLFQSEVQRLRALQHRNNNPTQRENAFALPRYTSLIRKDVWE